MGSDKIETNYRYHAFVIILHNEQLLPVDEHYLLVEPDIALPGVNRHTFHHFPSTTTFKLDSATASKEVHTRATGTDSW